MSCTSTEDVLRPSPVGDIDGQKDTAVLTRAALLGLPVPPAVFVAEVLA
jgi:hypothetical protein